ncbi:MAG: hypothetical protein R6W72_10460 [Desulfurivibrionaceae bacterium]
MGKYFVPNQNQHLFRRCYIFKMGPSQLLFVFTEYSAKRLLGAFGLFFFPGFPNVEQTGKHQKGYLFDYHQGVGDTACPEFGPKPVYLIFESVDH